MHKIILLIVTQLLFATGLRAQTRQELRDSLLMIEGLIVEHPKAVRLYLRKAALHIDLGQWDKALDDYCEVLGMMPSNLTALYYRGYVNQHLKRYAFARKDYETVLLVEPLHKNALVGLVYTNLADKRSTEAYDGANRLVELFPDTASVYAVRSDVEEALGMAGAAKEDIEKAIALEKPVAELKYPFSEADDMVTYQLSAFAIYNSAGKKRKARECLDYLEQNGITRAQLSEYYEMLMRK